MVVAIARDIQQKEGIRIGTYVHRTHIIWDFTNTLLHRNLMVIYSSN